LAFEAFWFHFVLIGKQVDSFFFFFFQIHGTDRSRQEQCAYKILFLYISILRLFPKIIDTLTNQPGMRSGSSLASCTKQIQAVRVFDHPKYANRLVLVDTPGFDDTHRSDIID
jgi:hypothetical protein